jgi:cobalt-zinc-cadmium efflux system membrane fusion protein
MDRITMTPANGGWLGIVLALAVVLGGAGCTGDTDTPSAAARPSEGDRGTAADATAALASSNTVKLDDAQFQRVKVATVQPRVFVVEKNAPGRIAFNEDRSTPVFAAFQGRVVRLMAKPGDVIRPGSPLLVIDSPDLVQANADLIAASVAVNKARNQLTLAERVATRQRLLYEAGAAAYKDLEQAESDFRNAQHDVRTAEGQLAAARNHMRAPFGKSDAEVAQIEATHEVDRLAQILSPIGGTITARKVGPGQYVKPDNPDPLFTIADISTMWLFANVYETDIALIQVGQSAEVQVMAYPNQIFRARITYIAAAADPATHRIAVRAEVANPDGKLRPEMFASFRILTSGAVQTPAVPTTAIVREGEASKVWVAVAPNEFAHRDVALGRERDGWTEVISGVQAGEQVVTEGGVFLSNIGQGGSASASTKAK